MGYTCDTCGSLVMVNPTNTIVQLVLRQAYMRTANIGHNMTTYLPTDEDPIVMHITKILM